jgi:small subunit ribosomal protein S13
MGYILNTYIEETTKPIVLSLQDIFGIGKQRAKYICFYFGLTQKDTFSTIPKYTKFRIIKFIKDNFIINDELKKKLVERQSFLLKINHYKGWRKKHNLPVRGQRTHTNAKTIRKQKY